MKPTRLPILIATFALAAAAAATAQTSAPASPGATSGGNPSGAPCARGAQQPVPGCERYGYRGDHHHHHHAHHHDGKRAGYGMRGERWFGRMDGDGDGQVSLAELQAAQQAAQQRQLQMFERADADRDGKVSRDEMRATRQAMWEAYRQQRRPGAPAVPGAPGAPAVPSGSAPAATPATSAGPDPEIYHRGRSGGPTDHPSAGSAGAAAARVRSGRGRALRPRTARRS